MMENNELISYKFEKSNVELIFPCITDKCILYPICKYKRYIYYCENLSEVIKIIERLRYSYKEEIRKQIKKVFPYSKLIQLSSKSKFKKFWIVEKFKPKYNYYNEDYLFKTTWDSN